MFVVQVAADIFQTKTNFEFSFPARPSLLELTGATESAFTNEIALRRPEHVPPHSFHVAKFKIYDEDRNKWTDLISETQLIDYCQCYAFQPENPWHKESPKEIPAAVKPPVANAARGTPQRASAYNPGVSARGAAYGGAGISQSGYPVGATYASGYPTAATAYARGNRPPIDATQEEKVRVVFAEFDVKGNRMLDIEDLKQGFRVLGFEFTTATINDLFQRADSNSDARISYAEFERFAKLYPIMTDCLYYRSKAFWDEETLARDVQGELDGLEEARRALEQAELAQQNAVKTAEEAQNGITKADEDIRELQGRQRDVARDMEQMHRDKEKNQREKHDRETELAQARDRERFAKQGLQDVQRDMDKHARKVQLAEQDAAKADDKVKQLQAALAEAQRAADRAHQNVRNIVADGDNIQARERDALNNVENATREIPRIEDGVKQAELQLQATMDGLRELEDLNRDMGREIEEAARRRDALEREAQHARDSEGRLAYDVEKLKARAAEKERVAKAKEAELLEQQRQRQLVTQQERALIEQELRLREQRDTLEEKESKLKTEAGTFLAGVRSTLASQSRTSYGRDGSSYK